ncbi:acyl-CoA dehydrogenase family protein [Actinomadura sp. NBRC 104425]|uniref:acyl-CoA dehydrogenase family protein n=1 Tax=Actinomadura sp. NBRC 104425 TaxID=3032204 RepID=UPI002556C6FA|nr:acyl-CoA dehydrogenase family protein [Actinomadura sp. NBRC 104425]
MSTTSTAGLLPRQDEEVTVHFLARAAAVDRGDDDVRPGLRWLGERNLLDVGAPDRGDGRLLPLLGTVESVARGCLSSAFALWAQRMTVEYLSRARPTALTEEFLGGLRSGRVTGASAMAPALKELSGLGRIPAVARKVDGGYRVDGPIPWASNLFPGAVVVLPARLDSPGREERVIVALRVGDEGVRVRPFPALLALNGTASSSVELRDVFVPQEAVLSTDLPSFCSSVRTTFLLIQTAFCSGLAAESLAQAERSLDGPDVVFADDLRELQAALASVRERLARYAAAPPAPAEVTRLRLDAAGTAVAATRLESAVKGGAGFLAAGHTARRVREAVFLPVQSPTEGHLRWDLER